MNFYFTTCNPINYKLLENWEKGPRKILWGYGKSEEGKFKGSEVGDCVLIMLNDNAHNNNGDTLFHCMIEDGKEQYETEDAYRNNPIDGKYVKKVNDLKFYKLRMLGKTDKIRKQNIINAQNKNSPILTWTKRNNSWGYSQDVKCLTNKDYLKSDFSKLLLEYKDDLKLSYEEVIVLNEHISDFSDSATIKPPTSLPVEGTEENSINQIDEPRNLIIFGAPGTGKSFKLNEKADPFDKVERVTFYPSYSYSQFVGCYKPTMNGENIAYSFVPGPFLRTYVDAVKNKSKSYLLIIEEINRADAASVFGDIFQLLDRDKDGKSVYSISTSEDVKAYIEKEKAPNSDKICIPANMYIWATMNSADQGVFPMDTAFKRRWDFLYFDLDGNPIKDNENCPVKKENWEKIREAINTWLCEKKVNEDKQLGRYFISTDDNVEEKDFRDAFKNKVLMYLFEDAARAFRSELFEKNSFSSILSEFNKEGTGIFKPDSIKQIVRRNDNAEERTNE